MFTYVYVLGIYNCYKTITSLIPQEKYNTIQYDVNYNIKNKQKIELLVENQILSEVIFLNGY